MGEDEAPQAPISSAIGARIEAPKGMRCGVGVSPCPLGRGMVRVCAANFLILSQYDEFWTFGAF